MASTNPNSGNEKFFTNFPSSWFASASTTTNLNNTATNPKAPSPGFLPRFVSEDQADGEMNVNRSTFLNALAKLRERLRPWSEFLNTSKFGWPPSIAAVAPRVKKNFQYFTTNYMSLVVILFIYCILTSFLMLLALVVLFGLFYSIYQLTTRGPVVIKEHEVPPSLMYTMALIICFPLFAMADVGEVMYWVIGSGMFLALAHATFFCSEEVPGAEFEVVTVVNA